MYSLPDGGVDMAEQEDKPATNGGTSKDAATATAAANEPSADQIDDEEDDVEAAATEKQRADLGDYASLGPYLVRFSPPDDIPPEHEELVRDIVVLDHRSIHALGAHGPARTEVKALLTNAVVTAGYWLAETYPPPMWPKVRNVAPARGLYQQAELIFERYLQSRNRLTYLGGVCIGIGFLVGVAFVTRVLPKALVESSPPELLPGLIFFAGLGAIVSVLLRLTSLDLVKEVSRTVLLVSGAARPFVASAFAVVVFLLLQSKLIAVSFAAEKDGGGATGQYLVIAFLCGFSERFAQELLDRVNIIGGSKPSKESHETQ
jgi:hypothetical protein